MELGNKRPVKKPVTIEAADRKANSWFAKRGIKPTLREYNEVAACFLKGANPLGIH